MVDPFTFDYRYEHYDSSYIQQGTISSVLYVTSLPFVGSERVQERKLHSKVQRKHAFDCFEGDTKWYL